MGVDIKITTDDLYFRYRTGAFLIHDNKMLLVHTNYGSYYYMIGGAVNILETTEHCVLREVFEETGLNAKVERLGVIVENFFRGFGGVLEGKDCHTLEFYYILSVDSIEGMKTTTDDGEPLCWIPLDEIKNTNIKPSFVTEKFDEILSSDHVIHYVEERDRNNTTPY